MRRLWWVLVGAGAAFAQNDLRFFTNGAGIAIHTQSSAEHSPLSTAGSVAGGAPAHRIVLDAENNPLFAYDFDLRKTPQGTVLLRIAPVDQEKARTEGWGVPKNKLKGDIPTLAATREFPPLNVGDEVQVDIMYHPVTHERLWDVLRIVEPAKGQAAPKRLPGERFSFERVKVAIDGKVVAPERNTWMIGQTILMRVGGHGDYYLVLNPPVEYPFQASGWVDHNVLRFGAGGEQIEITGKSNLLQNSEYGTVWVYYVPRHVEQLQKDLADLRRTYTDRHPKLLLLQSELAAAQMGGVDFTCSDDLSQILRK
jgi:hypothetical protein